MERVTEERMSTAIRSMPGLETTSTKDAMAGIAIRNLDDGPKRRLRIRGAEHGWSMEAEAREILRQAIGRPTAPGNLGVAIHRRSAALGGVEIDLPQREPMPEPPRFGRGDSALPLGAVDEVAVRCGDSVRWRAPRPPDRAMIAEDFAGRVLPFDGAAADT